MKQSLFEQNGSTYTQFGDYMLPDIRLSDQPEFELGVWANRRRQFLKQHHRIKYYNMLPSAPSIHTLPRSSSRLRICSFG